MNAASNRRHNPADGTLPQDIDAEQAVLGSLLIDVRAIERISSKLRPDDFFLSNHREIYEAMLRLHAQGKPTDTLLMAHELRAADRLEEVGGVVYLAALSNVSPTSIHAEYYAGIVRDLATKRRIVDAGLTIAGIGYDDSVDGSAALDEATQLLGQIQGPAGRPDWEDKGSSLDRLYQRLTGPYAEDDSGLTTGLTPLDRLMGGMRRGDLIIVGARPSIGKTSLGATIAHHVGIKLGLPVLFFSLEMLRDRIWEKLVSIDSGLPWHTVTGHTMTEDEQRIAAEGFARLKDSPLDVVPAREWTVDQIRGAAREAHRHNPLSLVIVDYLQIIETSGRGENRVQEIAGLTKSLKGMGLELECPVWTLSQLNREPEKRSSHFGRDPEEKPEKDPLMSQLRDGGTQENDADVVILLSPPNGRRKEPRPAVEEIVTQVAKNRLGRTGKVTLGLRGEHMQFVDLAWESQPAGLVDRVLHRHEEEPSWSC